MGVRDLLDDLTEAGFSVEADGDRLVIRPASMLPDHLRARLRDDKPELLALLAADIEDPRTAARRARLILWGWPGPRVRETVERLALRDREVPDGRVSCTECQHYRAVGRCARSWSAGLDSPNLVRGQAGMLRRCDAFMENTL